MQRAIRGFVVVLALIAVGAPVARAVAPPLSVPSTSYPTIAAFEAAAGGADNGTATGERGSGFRHWTPAGIAVDGSDPGSTAIPGGHTAALATSRLQPWGIELGANVAVANDGFASVNPNAGSANGFTPLDLWAPFNVDSTTFQVIAPASQTGAATPAVTRGLGVVFVNAATAGATISYYSGNMLVGQVSPQNGATFAGLLFDSPVVTRVVVTLGSNPMFGFDGSSFTPGTGSSSTLAAGDDIVVAEPGAGQTTAAATAAVPVSASLASFDSTDPAAGITATVNWGDGTASAGTIVPQGAGAFTVTGSHTYALPGSYTAKVTVQDFSGNELQTQAVIQVAPRSTQTAVTCSPSAVAVSATTLCAAVVSDSSPGSPTAPTGVVTFSSPSAGGSFPTAGSCTLGAIAVPGTSMCVVQFEASQRPPVHAVLSAVYRGDSLHTASQAATAVVVVNQRCSLSALSRRLRAGGFGLLVTCDARANVQVGAQAHATRSGPFRAFALNFGSGHLVITPGRPTVLVIRPVPGVVRALRVALARDQHVSLKLTLTAVSHATRTTTTKRVSAIRAF